MKKTNKYLTYWPDVPSECIVFNVPFPEQPSVVPSNGHIPCTKSFSVIQYEKRAHTNGYLYWVLNTDLPEGFAIADNFENAARRMFR